MTADKSSSTTISPLAAIALKLVGVISILSFLVDLANLLLPPDFLNPVWLAGVINNIVERGIIPFLGITLLLVGFWVDRTSGRSKQPGSLLIDLRFWSCLLASILGLLFIVLPIVNITNNQPLGRVLVERAEQEVNQERGLAQQALAARFEQRRNELQVLIQNEELLQQLIDSGELETAINDGRVPENILDFRGDPEGLDNNLRQLAEADNQRIQAEANSQLEDNRRRINGGLLKSVIVIAINGLLLAIGHIVIGWIGLRRLVSVNRN